MRILVLFATIEGHTGKIAQHVSSMLEKAGHDVRMINATQEEAVPGAEEFDASIIAAPIHIGTFPAPMRRLVKTNADTLMARPGAFVSVSLAAASSVDEELEEVAKYVEEFSEETGWWPLSVHHAAGALKYTEYDFFRRWMLKRIAAKEGGPTDTSRDYEFTDWDALDGFIDNFVAQAPAVAGKI